MSKPRPTTKVTAVQMVDIDLECVRMAHEASLQPNTLITNAFHLQRHALFLKGCYISLANCNDRESIQEGTDTLDRLASMDGKDAAKWLKEQGL